MIDIRVTTGALEKTVLPLLRVVLGIVIPLVAVMIALSQLGVDTCGWRAMSTLKKRARR